MQLCIKDLNAFIIGIQHKIFRYHIEGLDRYTRILREVFPWNPHLSILILNELSRPSHRKLIPDSRIIFQLGTKNFRHLRKSRQLSSMYKVESTLIQHKFCIATQLLTHQPTFESLILSVHYN